MSGNVKFRWFLLAPLLVVLFVVISSPVISMAGELEDAKEDVRKYPNDSAAHYNLGIAYDELGRYKEAIASYYVQVKVKEQAAIEGREQVPELQGDTEKVLVQW